MGQYGRPNLALAGLVVLIPRTGVTTDDSYFVLDDAPICHRKVRVRSFLGGG